MLYTDLEDILGKVRASLEIDDLAGAVAALESLRAPDQADLFHELEDNSSRPCCRVSIPKTRPTFWKN